MKYPGFTYFYTGELDFPVFVLRNTDITGNEVKKWQKAWNKKQKKVSKKDQRYPFRNNSPLFCFILENIQLKELEYLL